MRILKVRVRTLLGFKLESERGGKVTLNGEVITESCFEKDNECESYLILNMKYSDAIRELGVLEILGERSCIKYIQIESMNEIANLMVLKETKTELCYHPSPDNKLVINFWGDINFVEWNKGYTIREFVYKLREIIEPDSQMKITIFYGEYSKNEAAGEISGIEFVTTDVCLGASFGENEEKLMQLLHEYYLKAHQNLMHKNNSILFEFEIDNDFMIPCRQYLDYFIQFLRDIGIEAQSNSYEYINKLLFEVIPQDQETALNNIKESLIIYLSLINNPDIETYDAYDNVAYTQLKANISHLKSQLMLAQATIEQKQMAINMMKNIVIKDKIEDTNKKEVELLQGVITLGEVDCKVFKINLGQLLKLLMRR